MKIVKTIKIGRHENCDYQLSAASEKTSRNHATLYLYSDGRIELEDTSTNGTFVNSTKVHGKKVWIKKDDLVKFADQERLDWSKINVPKKSKLPVVFGSLLIAVILGAGAYLFYPKSNRCTMTTTEIREKYDKSVGLVCMVYYLKTKLSNGLTYFIGMDEFGNLDVNLEIKNLKPLFLTGSGFLVKKTNPVDNGNLVTNRHVADPAYALNRREGDFYYLNQEFFNDIDKNIQELEKWLGLPNSTNRVYETHPFIIKYFPSKSILPFNQDMSDFEVLSKIGDGNSQILRWSKDESIDLAVLVTEHNPEYNYIDLKENVSEDIENIKVGESVTLLGYSGGIGAGYDIETSELNYQTSAGRYTKDPTNFQLFYDIPTQGGSSGAPIFNCSGKLVGINYAKTDINSMGVPVKHLLKVMNFENVVVKTYKGESSL